MRSILHALVTAFGLSAGLGLSGGAALGQSAREDLRAVPRLVPEHTVATPGEILWLAVHFEIEEGWHTYWPGQNDTGMAMDAVFDTSESAMAGAPVWPAPHRYESPGEILDHVFEERVSVLVPIVVLPNAAPGRDIEIRMDARWLVCADVCLMESTNLSLSIPVAEPGAAAARPARETVELFEAARARIPEPLDPEAPLVAAFENDTLTLRAAGAARVAFYPADDGRAPTDLLRAGEVEGEELALRFDDGPEPVRGVAEIWTDENTSRVFLIELPPAGEAETE